MVPDNERVSTESKPKGAVKAKTTSRKEGQMFVNLGDVYIQTQNIRVVDMRLKTVHDYQGFTHPVTVDMEKLAAEIIEADKANHRLYAKTFDLIGSI